MTSMTSPPQTDGGRAPGFAFQGQQQFSPGQQQFGQQFGQQFAQGQQQATTPMMAGFARAAGEQAPAQQSGIATAYWYEAIPLPAGPPRLNLSVGGQWVFSLNPAPVILDLIQQVFLTGKGRVRVWYDSQNNVINGLVIEG